jgi:hypothetical protein
LTVATKQRWEMLNRHVIIPGIFGKDEENKPVKIQFTGFFCEN